MRLVVSVNRKVRREPITPSIRVTTTSAIPRICSVSRLRWAITLSMITWIKRGLARLKSCTTKEASSTCSNMPR